MEIEKAVLDEFYKIITPNKVEMFDRIASLRTKYLTIALENIYQEHNASAVLRSCDCFGLQEMHVIEKGFQYSVQRDIALGAGRWVDLFNYNLGENPTDDCILNLQNRGYKIVATTPHTDAHTIHDLPIDQPLAFFFGTERRGLSQEVIERSDYQVKIPMYGFTESFNISVSVAILLQTIRQRLEKSNLDWRLTSEEQISLKIKWCRKILNGGQALENEIRKRLIEKEL
ncbi:MAG: TrmH family RNA methyltransferase [Crocinitomicaceae bacterium]|jgi:tRNA (guanosine-2'-O-)-methyltransferase